MTNLQPWRRSLTVLATDPRQLCCRGSSSPSPCRTPRRPPPQVVDDLRGLGIAQGLSRRAMKPRRIRHSGLFSATVSPFPPAYNLYAHRSSSSSHSMITWRLIVRYFRRCPGHSTLTLLSIAIGSCVGGGRVTGHGHHAAGLWQRMYEEYRRPARPCRSPRRPMRCSVKTWRKQSPESPGFEPPYPVTSGPAGSSSSINGWPWSLSASIRYTTATRGNTNCQGRFLTLDDGARGLLEAGSPLEPASTWATR